MIELPREGEVVKWGGGGGGGKEAEEEEEEEGGGIPSPWQPMWKNTATVV